MQEDDTCKIEQITLLQLRQYFYYHELNIIFGLNRGALRAKIAVCAKKT
jgi:hypothetical protein